MHDCMALVQLSTVALEAVRGGQAGVNEDVERFRRAGMQVTPHQVKMLKLGKIAQLVQDDGESATRVLQCGQGRGFAGSKHPTVSARYPTVRRLTWRDATPTIVGTRSNVDGRQATLGELAGAACG